MSRRVEYRVRWKREGRQASYRIYQKWESACRKASGIASLEAIKNETSFESMPDLEEGPVIESRPVGDWEPVEHAVIHVSDYSKDAMRQWAEYSRPASTTYADADVPF